jgi:hypothetical protein
VMGVLGQRMGLRETRDGEARARAGEQCAEGLTAANPGVPGRDSDRESARLRQMIRAPWKSVGEATTRPEGAATLTAPRTPC